MAEPARTNPSLLSNLESLFNPFPKGLFPKRIPPALFTLRTTAFFHFPLPMSICLILFFVFPHFSVWAAFMLPSFFVLRSSLFLSCVCVLDVDPETLDLDETSAKLPSNNEIEDVLLDGFVFFSWFIIYFIAMSSNPILNTEAKEVFFDCKTQI